MTYTLSFTAGASSDASGVPLASTYINDSFIDKNIRVGRAMPDGLPIGIVEAATMKFTIRLNTLYNSVNDTMEDLRQWIIDGDSGTDTKTVNGRAISIPNRWWLTRTIGVNTVYIFDGVQSDKSTKTIKYNNTEELLIEIECISIEKAVFEELKKSDLNPTIENTNSVIFPLAYSGVNILGQNEIKLWTQKPDSLGADSIDLCTITNLIEDIESKASLLLRAYRRGLDYTSTTQDTWVNFTNSIFSNWTFYKNNHLTTWLHGDGLGDNGELYFIAYINKDSERIGGHLYPGNDDNNPTVWDMLKSYFEGSASRCDVKYNLTTHKIDITFAKIFDVRATASAITDSMLADSSVEISMGNAGKYIAMCESENPCLDGGVTNNTYRLYGTKSDDSYAVALSLHNVLGGFETIHSTTRVYNNDVSKYLTYCSFGSNYDTGLLYSKYVMISGLFSDTYNGVHDYCKVSIDATTDVISEELTNPLPPTYSSTYEADNEGTFLMPSIINRYTLSGIGYTASKAIITAFGKPKQCVIKIRMHGQHITDASLNQLFTFDIDSLFNIGNFYNGGAGRYGNEAYITSYELDINNNTADCELFLRGV